LTRTELVHQIVYQRELNNGLVGYRYKGNDEYEIITQSCDLYKNLKYIVNKYCKKCKKNKVVIKKHMGQRLYCTKCIKKRKQTQKVFVKNNENILCRNPFCNKPIIMNLYDDVNYDGRSRNRVYCEECKPPIRNYDLDRKRKINEWSVLKRKIDKYEREVNGYTP